MGFVADSGIRELTCTMRWSRCSRLTAHAAASPIFSTDAPAGQGERRQIQHRSQGEADISAPPMRMVGGPDDGP